MSKVVMCVYDKRCMPPQKGDQRKRVNDKSAFLLCPHSLRQQLTLTPAKIISAIG